MSEQDAQTPPVDSKIAKRLFEMRTVLIHGEVDSRMARDVTAQMLALSGESDDDITIYIHSEGGHVESGDSIHDISLAAPKQDRYCLPTTRFLIHQPMGGAGGAATDIQIEAEEILKARDRLNRLIAEKTGQSIEQVSQDTDRNHWMSPEEARDYGIVGKIIKSASEL